jgi:hypothetical protein
LDPHKEREQAWLRAFPDVDGQRESGLTDLQQPINDLRIQ